MINYENNLYIYMINYENAPEPTSLYPCTYISFINEPLFVNLWSHGVYPKSLQFTYLESDNENIK